MPEDPGPEREASTMPASIGVLEVVSVPGTSCWAVRVTIAHADGPLPAWTPMLFDGPEAAEAWLAGRARHQLRPAVRACEPHTGMACAAVLDAAGDELLLSGPLRRSKAAAAAALLAAELRARSAI